MSKYNESSTKWKLDSWHEIVLQIFILALIGGLSIFIYAKFFGGDKPLTGTKDTIRKNLEARNVKLKKERDALQDQIGKAGKVVNGILGDGGKARLTIVHESFNDTFALLGSLIDEDQNATFKDAQSAYRKMDEALQTLKDSELHGMSHTIRTNGWAVTAQKGNIRDINTLINSRKLDVAEYDAAVKAGNKEEAKKNYQSAIKAEAKLQELELQLEEAKPKLKKLQDNVKQAEADKKELEKKIADYDDGLKEFKERMEAWKGLVKKNNEEKDERIENGKKLVELRGILSGTNMIAVVEEYTEKRLKKSIKEKDDFIAFAETEIKRKTKAIAVSEESLKNLIKLYGNIGIIIPDDSDSSLPPLLEESVPPLPGLLGVDPVPPATGHGPIDPATGVVPGALPGGAIDPTTGLPMPPPTGLGGIPVIPAGGAVGVGDTAAQKAKASVEKTRAEIKKRRSEVEQLKKDKLETEGSLKKLKEDIATFKAAQKARVEESSKAGSRMAELKEAKTQLDAYKEKINETDWADAVAEYHKVNEANLMVKLQSRKEEQAEKRKLALAEIRLLEGDLKKANNDVNVAERQLIRALKARKDEELVEDLQEDLSQREEMVEIIQEDLELNRKESKDAGEEVKKLTAQITVAEKRISDFNARSKGKAAEDDAKKKAAEKLGDVYDMLYGEDWEKAAIDFVRSKEEAKTKLFEERKQKSKSAAEAAKKRVGTLKKTGTALEGQLAIWEGILDDGDRITKKTAEKQVKKITLKINNNDLESGEAVANVEKSEENYNLTLKIYETRLKDVKKIVDELDAREEALIERRKHLVSADANSGISRMFFDIASSREITRYQSDLTTRITSLQGKETKLSNEVESLKKVVAEKEGELRLKKEELEIVTEKFDADPDTYPEGETVQSIGLKIKNLQKEVRTISNQIKDNQGRLAKAERNYNDTKSQRAASKQALFVVINHNKPKKPGPTIKDPALKQLEVAFKPYFTDPKGNDHGYDEAVHLVIRKPKDKTTADELFKTKKVAVEESVEEFNAFRELREGKSGQAKKNYTTLMDEIWDKIREDLSTTLDENGQFHYKNKNFTKDGETLFVFCIGRKDDKVRFYVDEITFAKSPTGPRRIQLSSVN